MLSSNAQYLTYGSSLTSPVFFSELKRRMKAEKKAAEKEAKVKELVEQKKESNDQGAQNACALDEETLDPNVRFFYGSYHSLFIIPVMFWSFLLCEYNHLLPSYIAILQDPLPGRPGAEGHS